MERWVENGETVCEDNGDDWKLKIVGASSTAIVPCDETEVLTNDELPSIPSDVSSVDFGNCITQINCRITDDIGSSKNPATVHFGDYVEVIGNGSAEILNGYLRFDEHSFDDNLRIINNGAFSRGYNTYSNNTVYLGSRIESIGDYAFINPDSDLHTLKIDTVSPPKIGLEFFDFGYDITNRMNCILVPRGSVSDYKNAWTSYAECIYSLAEEDTFYRATYSDGTKGWNFSSEGTNGMLSERMVQVLYGGHYKDSITDVYLSNEVTSIDRYAFYSCKSLTSITIPNTVTKIDEEAFENCSGLTSLTFNPIENGVIGCWAFSNCRGLRRINIGSGVTKIGDMAFSDIITHDAADNDYDDNYCPPESDIVVYCYATTPPEVRTDNAFGDVNRNSPFVYSGRGPTGASEGFLYKPVVYVPCSSMVAYKTSRWHDICLLKPIEGVCDGICVNAPDTIVSTSSANNLIAVESWVTDRKFPKQIIFDKNYSNAGSVYYCWGFFNKTDGTEFLSMPSSTENIIKINGIKYYFNDTRLPSYVTYKNDILTVDLVGANVYGDVYLHSYQKNFLIGNVDFMF